MIRDRSLGRGCTGTLRLRRPTATRTLRVAAPAAAASARSHPHTAAGEPSLVSFGEDGRGRVYAVSLDGPIYRIGPALGAQADPDRLGLEVRVEPVVAVLAADARGLEAAERRRRVEALQVFT